MLQCFMLTPTGKTGRSLRRYASSFDKKANKHVANCPSVYQYHNAHAPLDIVDTALARTDDTWPKDDTRWPTKCEHCDYQFTESDEYQLFCRDLYEGNGITTTLVEAPPGAMWYCPRYHDPADPEDQKERATTLAELAGNYNVKLSLLSSYYWLDWSDKRPPICVKLPNGSDFIVDQVSSNGFGWKVEGSAPTLTVSPSISCPGYHGFLGTSGAQPGFFTDDVEGRGPMGIPAKQDTTWKRLT